MVKKLVSSLNSTRLGSSPREGELKKFYNIETVSMKYSRACVLSQMEGMQSSSKDCGDGANEVGEEEKEQHGDWSC